MMEIHDITFGICDSD